MSFLKKSLRKLINKFGFDIIYFDPDPQPFGIYIYDDIKFFLKDLKDPTFIDIGANNGQSIIRMKHHFNDCKIHSFEPSPSTYIKLNDTAINYTNVSTYNLGIGNEIGELFFHENSLSEMSSFLKAGPSSWGEVKKAISVNVDTLDNFCAKNNISEIDFIKSDTQGFEMQVIQGAKELMKNNQIKLIYFEVIFSDMYENMTSFDEVFKYMIDNNFSIVTMYKPNFRNHVMSWNDALFINNEYLKTIQ